ncbi:oxidoreductase [Henriciella litoralis]|uniref:oxidoreductase n=1 Tax=Henriciella litoralis TaxID=568102 RepID=UPI003898F7F6
MTARLHQSRQAISGSIKLEKLDPLFQPLQVRDLEIRGRLTMAPMTRNYSPDGVPPDFAVEFYGRRADHDLGLVVTEGIAIDHPSAIGESGTGGWDIPDLHGDAALGEWARIVRRVKSSGAAIFPQLWHQGGLRVDYTGRHKEARSISPSGIWGPDDPGNFFAQDYLDRARASSHPATDEELADIVAAYGRSAKNAIEAGFDGIAIHGAHGYLLDTFFWPLTNRRTDRWGGASLRERAAFPAAVVREIRQQIGDKPIMFRFSQWKLHDYEAKLVTSPAELEALLGPLLEAGVDIFDASTRKFATPAFEGSTLSLAAWTKTVTGSLTMAVGGVGLAKDLLNRSGAEVVSVDNIDDARAMLRNGECDLVGVGRSLLSNPDFGSRVRSGEPLRPYTLEAALTKV